MEIILGETAGFCFGVMNAVTKTIEKLKQTKEKVYCLGELTHNKQVMDNLRKCGLKEIQTLEEVEELSTVIIRAHGVAKEIYHKAEQRRIALIDLTCPRVLAIHKLAEQYMRKGYFIILIGEKNHPECIGTISFCGENSDIISTKEEVSEVVKKYKKTGLKKCIVIAQTTYSVKQFEEITNELKKDIQVLEINKTICNATDTRQTETKKLSKQVDIMIIIGGKNSSNTKKLYEIAKQNCKKAIWIETRNELNVKELNTNQKIGIMAGASTPRESIEGVINELTKRSGK